MHLFQNFRDNTVIRIPAGIHRFTEPIRIEGRRNIRFVGEDGAVLRGTVALSRADFTEEEPGVFSAPVPHPADGFYIGGRRYEMARYPKKTDPDAPFGGYAADCILPEKTKTWSDPAGGYIHAMHKHLWGGFSYRIDGRAPDGSLLLSGGWQNNRQMGMHDEYRYAENIREEMTEPGEWFFDEKRMRVVVRLFPGDDLDKAEAAVSEGFFDIRGCEGISFENLSFGRTVRTFMKTKEPLLRSDWTIYRGGALVFRDSARCSVDRCVLEDIGSNGVFVDGRSTEIAVTRTRISETGASGVCFVGHPDAVRSPLFEYNETQTLDEIDKTPGPKSENYPRDGLVEDCLIERVGLTEKQATGVEISMAARITVRNCTVCRTSRAGINISEGTFGGHRIEGCDVFDTVRETGDHGSFNSWGRDRYWHLDGLDDREAGQYAALDMTAPNVLARNRFRCDRGWDIDLDDGSSCCLIEENLCLAGGIKLREGFFRTVRRNICIGNTLHAHVWYPASGDTAEGNIFFAPYSPYGMPERWGERIDDNIFFDPALPEGETEPAEALAEVSGQDAHSLRRSIRFRAPEEGDFRPVDVPGFEDFPAEFGVRYAPLRAIAPVPEIPRVAVPASEANSSSHMLLAGLGLEVRDIETDGEMSVYGTAEHRGALVLAVEAGSPAETIGLRALDVITDWNGCEIRCAADLSGEEKITSVRVLRKQKAVELKEE